LYRGIEPRSGEASVGKKKPSQYRQRGEPEASLERDDLSCPEVGGEKSLKSREKTRLQTWETLQALTALGGLFVHNSRKTNGLKAHAPRKGEKDGRGKIPSKFRYGG